ncbi:MAG TPA: ADOP family duplicated permease [Vicinamibacterales bacterium]|nr:ADOP family duplicated permease [Vicinamibacterales bacterium]
MKTELLLAFRSLVRFPFFTAAVILTLAFGVGATTTMFSVVYGVLYRPLPYPDAERLVALWVTRAPDPGIPDQTVETRVASRIFVANTLLDTWRREAGAFEGIAGFRGRRFTVAGRRDAARVDGAVTTASFFSVLGLHAVMGRVFQPGEDRPGHDEVVVIGHAFWREYFGGDPNVVGQTLRVDGSPHTVIGVLGADARLPLQYAHRQPALYTPMSHEFTKTAPFSILLCVARLRPGRTVASAQAEMTGVMRHLTATTGRYSGRGVNVAPLASEVVETSNGTRAGLLILLAGTLCVLLIACANVANLLLVRAAARHRELAIRTALGAGRWQVMRPMLLESLLMSGIGGLAGLLLAVWGTRAIVALMPADLFPRIEEVRVDAAVLAFGETAALLAGLLAALAPAFYAIVRARQGRLAEEFNGGQRALAGGRGSRLIRRGLVTVEVALAAVLLVGAGLLGRTYVALLDADLGLTPERALTFALEPLATKYPNAADRVSLVENVLSRLGGISHIQEAGAVESLPVMSFLPEVQVAAGQQVGDASVPAALNRASPGFFEASGVRLREGRLFERRDGTDRVAILDLSLARRLLPGGAASTTAAIGQTIEVEDTAYRVVGVVDDAKYRDRPGKTSDVVYLPFASSSADRFSIVVRTPGEPTAALPAIRAVVRLVDADIPMEAIQTLEEVRDTAIGPQRFRVALVGAFAGLALLLATLGLYGVVAQSVSQRTQELGIRLALGARRGRLLARVVLEGVVLAGGGVVMGVLVSGGAARVLENVLFGVTPLDGTTYGAVALTLVFVAAAASLLAARHAASIDPVQALRKE